MNQYSKMVDGFSEAVLNRRPVLPLEDALNKGFARCDGSTPDFFSDRFRAHRSFSGVLGASPASSHDLRKSLTGFWLTPAVRACYPPRCNEREPR